MKQIVLVIIVLVGALAGGAGGVFLKSRPASVHDSAPKASSHKSDSHGAESSHGDEKKAKKSGGHGSGHGSSDSSEVVYYKFSREFVVPLLENDKVKSLVILNINLEAEADVSGKLFSMEPKLRDNIMTTLINLSNDGVTLEEITDVHSYETIRSSILENLHKVVASGIKNVLILDVAKQDL